MWMSWLSLTCSKEFGFLLYALHMQYLITTSFLTLLHNDLYLSLILFTIVNMVHYVLCANVGTPHCSVNSMNTMATESPHPLPKPEVRCYQSICDHTSCAFSCHCCAVCWSHCHAAVACFLCPSTRSVWKHHQTELCRCLALDVFYFNVHSAPYPESRSRCSLVLVHTATCCRTV